LYFINSVNAKCCSETAIVYDLKNQRAKIWIFKLFKAFELGLAPSAEIPPNQSVYYGFHSCPLGCFFSPHWLELSAEC